MGPYSTLTCDIVGYRADVGLNRPDNLNAISETMCQELTELIATLQAEERVRSIVLFGHGRMFSAGGDLKTASSAGADEVLEKIFKPALLGVLKCRVPIIAAVQGAAVGVAGSLMMCCDLVVMEEDAYLSAPFVGLGLIPDGGTSWHLIQNLGGKRATEVVLDGREVSAEECRSAGISNRVVGAGRALADARAWADAIAELPPLAVTAAIQALRFSAVNSLEESMSFEAELLASLSETEDAKEGLAAFLEKRKPVFKGE